MKIKTGYNVVATSTNEEGGNKMRFSVGNYTCAAEAERAANAARGQNVMLNPGTVREFEYIEAPDGGLYKLVNFDFE